MRESLWTVEIVKRTTGEVVQRMPTYSHRSAEQVERGASINLNHEEYFVRVTCEKAPARD